MKISMWGQKSVSVAKVLAVKPNDLVSTPQTYVVEREN